MDHSPSPLHGSQNKASVSDKPLSPSLPSQDNEGLGMDDNPRLAEDDILLLDEVDNNNGFDERKESGPDDAYMRFPDNEVDSDGCINVGDGE